MEKNGECSFFAAPIIEKKVNFLRFFLFFGKIRLMHS